MNLTIDQMRAIVEGAPDDTAEFYSKQSYWKTEGGESFIGNRFDGWRRTHWDVSTVRHWNMTKLSEIRAAIAEHDASINPQDAETATVAEVPGYKVQGFIEWLESYMAAEPENDYDEVHNATLETVIYQAKLQLLGEDHGHD